MPRSSRRPTHAGSWYEDDGSRLASQIQQWIDAVPTPKGSHARAIISPHAGYSYCGHVMAHAYKQIGSDQVSRVFVLGPSHHHYTRRCCISPASSYNTPLGPIEIAQDVYQELKDTGEFDIMDIDVDEAEHSLELQMAYLAYIMRGKRFQLVPIMVGSLTPEREAAYGRLLAKYMDDESNVFIISSDFCHWGSRFSYTFNDSSKGPIYKAIEWLDTQGMDIIEQGDPKAFTEYLRRYGNTICGRHPIGVFLNVISYCRTKFQISFENYDQSSRVLTFRDSSVSYAAAIVIAAAES
ncbi:Protein MEMO1 [Coccomyxa sp. Obi]|nr:Protein MEMO1 [Coccomyxa sp. Obi]